MTQNNESFITPQIDNTIKNLVKELELLPDLGEKISEKVNNQYATNFTTSQIRQYLKDKLKIKIPQNRGVPFTEQIDNSIKELMEELGDSSNPYAQIIEIINKNYNTRYTSKQIRQRWISKLDTNICHDPLGDDEKAFIVQWVESTQRGDMINWRKLIPLMKIEFGKLRTENMVKNFWNLRKRCNNKSKAENGNSRKRSKRSPKSKAKDERRQHEYNIAFEKDIKSLLTNGENNLSSPLNTNEENKNIHSPLSNASSMEIISENEKNAYLPPLNTIPMETSFKKGTNIHLPPLNTSPVGTLPPLNANPIKENASRLDILCLIAIHSTKK
ncbi:hypothetical protein RclHR1_05000008 [Rhizophagus clarus]|uniref:HTH myb-type domain-containing protein n=1 Tax=Rhizophagus clarus TaxID=94130 RepID=A0A2Z6RXQ7_9GLOM|nr:hypothetical protein RclHR1_05000008 [Rhizophagus clarus]GET03668.1 hypothetical protein GLOIN_2v1876577 [Rhizophagus clarus]